MTISPSKAWTRKAGSLDWLLIVLAVIGLMMACVGLAHAETYAELRAQGWTGIMIGGVQVPYTIHDSDSAPIVYSSQPGLLTQEFRPLPQCDPGYQLIMLYDHRVMCAQGELKEPK